MKSVEKRLATKKQPEPGLGLYVDFVRAIDGDTIEVEVRRRVHIRLEGIDVVEKKEPGGEKATEYVADICGVAGQLFLFVPSHDILKLMDFTSFERVRGDIWVNGKLLADLLRKKGFEKP